jgi:hypothetical protein
VKGEFHQELWLGGSYYYFNGYVTDAHIYSGYANLEIYIYDVSTDFYLVGQTLYVHVHDGGEPGIGVDTVGGGFDPDDSYPQYPIYEGNIQVHN